MASAALYYMGRSVHERSQNKLTVNCLQSLRSFRSLSTQKALPSGALPQTPMGGGGGGGEGGGGASSAPPYPLQRRIQEFGKGGGGGGGTIRGAAPGRGREGGTPPAQLGGVGERCKLPHWGLGRSTRSQRVLR